MKAINFIKIFEFFGKHKLKIILISILFFSRNSFAQDTSEDLFNVLDSIEKIFYEASSSWLLNAETYAKQFLITLAVIDIVVIGMKHVLKVDSIQDIFSGIILKTFVIGGILTLLQLLPMLTDPNRGFLKGFEILGSRITGVNKLSPTGVIDTGLEVVNVFIQHMKNAPITAFFQAGIYLIAVAVIIYCFLTVAIELLTTKIEAYILMFGGCFFLCLGGSKYTKKYSDGYLTYCLTTAIKLFIAYLVVAVGVGIGEIVAERLGKDPIAQGDYQAVIVTVVIFVMYAAIAKKISAIANGFLSGMTSTSSGDHFATGGAAVATTAAIATGGKTAAPGSINGIMGGIGSGLGKMAGNALFKGAGHAHAAKNSMSSNMAHNMANGSPIETAAPKAAAQTMSSAAKNIGASIKNSISGKASNLYNNHKSNVNSSPFSEQKMPPPPSSKKS